MECPVGDVEALKSAILAIQKGKPQGNYLNATCSIYPPRRVIRRATLEPKRLKDPAYLPEVCLQQFRIEADKYILAMIDSSAGAEFDPATATGKEVIFCGLPSDDLVIQQDSLLESGLYPDRIELGSVSNLGAALSFLTHTGNRAPTLLLEIGSEVTHSFILSENGVEASRPIPYGLDAMIPVIQKKLTLKDEESTRKLFFSNTFDFTSMGPELVQRLLKELQSSIGFYEVQTGQSISRILCLGLPSKLGWIEGTISSSLGLSSLSVDMPGWLKAQGITVADSVSVELDRRWFGLFALMMRHVTPGNDHAADQEKK